MSELAESSRNVVATTIGGIATSVAAVLAAGAPALWPLVLPAAAGALAQEAVNRSVRRKARRAERFVQTAEAASGRSFDELLTGAALNDDIDELFAVAADVAVQARDEWIIDRAADLFVGAISDSATVDERLLLLAIIRQLDPMHVRVLRAVATRARSAATASRRLVIDLDPGLEPALDHVLARLMGLGLLANAQDTYLTELGRKLVSSLIDHAEAKTVPAAAPDGHLLGKPDDQVAG